MNHLFDECQERVQSLVHVSRSLTFFLKESAMDISEIDADGFNGRLDKILEHLQEPTSGPDIEKIFSAHKLAILDWIGIQKHYIQEKEDELKNIIELLRAGLNEMIGDTQNFSAQLYERNIKMEAITELNDLRKIKESLKGEVTQMKQLIQKKQTSDSRRIESLSNEVGVLRSSLEQVRDASRMDALTGAFNRMAFDMYIQRMIERSQVAWDSVSLLMCDLDNFKNINDTYGHIVGDRVLKCFVQECQAMFRIDDFIARYGGEEFAIILPGISLKKALKRAKSFCKILADKQFLVDSSQSDERIGFTVSIGVGELYKNDVVESWILRADKALYQAKNMGKNRAIG
ncbi:MAG: GGDEF domain-containing protein [Desulfatirhabdiaceae bacterium]